MSKFSAKRVRPMVRSVIKTVGKPTARTFEGARALVRDPKSELFLLSITNMVGEATFYEGADTRDQRFIDLVHTVTREDPEWMQRFVPWLRNSALMRSAAVVAAAEYVAAGGPHGRAVIASAVARADEPAEILGYWTQFHGRKIPQPVKRGVADAVRRQYSEYAALKYDGLSRAWRMGDVIEMTHPKPRDDKQSAVFRYLLDRRHHPEALEVPDALETVRRRFELEGVDKDARRDMLRAQGAALMAEAGATWEWLSGWLPGGMDAEAWNAVIPSMGYMALLRNLRNFDEAGISDERARYVREVLADPERVAESRQFPYRFWSAYKNAPSLTWAATLEAALELSVGNIPELPGRTLVLTDTSASMQGQVSRRSKVRHFEVAALFAAALAGKAHEVELISFASESEMIRFRKRQSVLRTIERVDSRIGAVGHGTQLGAAVRRWFDGHDRVVVFSDMQTADQVPGLAGTQVYVFNTGGYRATPFAVGKAGHYEIGGFSDAAFRLMATLENFQDAGWPF
ncbi:MAG: TROVE domain-containing protein [bacterium]|nr:TROVE domain-containing protein [bacterium]